MSPLSTLRPLWNWGKTLKIVNENESTKEEGRPNSSEALPLPLNKFSVIPCCRAMGFPGWLEWGKMFSNHPFVQTRGVPAIGWDGERCFHFSNHPFVQTHGVGVTFFTFFIIPI
jgi:hypothetical protein